MPEITLFQVGTISYSRQEIEKLILDDIKSQGMKPTHVNWGAKGGAVIDVEKDAKVTRQSKKEFSSLNKRKNSIGNKGLNEFIKTLIDTNGGMVQPHTKEPCSHICEIT